MSFIEIWRKTEVIGTTEKVKGCYFQIITAFDFLPNSHLILVSVYEMPENQRVRIS